MQARVKSDMQWQCHSHCIGVRDFGYGKIREKKRERDVLMMMMTMMDEDMFFKACPIRYKYRKIE